MINNSIRQITSLEETERTKYFRRWATAGWLLFIVLFYLPVPGELNRNIFFIGAGFPALLWLFLCPSTLFILWRSFKEFLWPLLGIIFLFALHDPTQIRLLFYISSLFASLLLLQVKIKNMTRIFSFSAVLNLGLLVFAAGVWLLENYKNGIWIRVQLWGRTDNPIFAAMLCISALAFIWMFYIDPRFCSRSKKGFSVGFSWYLALLVFAVLSLVCIIVFQARTALLGFSLFIAGYLIQRRLFFKGLLIALLAFLTLYAFGLLELLGNRGLSYRTAIWEDALSQLWNTCGLWIGCSGRDYQFLGEFHHPHSAYISIFYQLGIPGLILFAWFCYRYFLNTWKAQSRWMLVSLCGWGGLLTESNGVFISPHPLWIFFWCPVFLSLLEIKQEAIKTYFQARFAAERKPETPNPPD